MDGTEALLPFLIKKSSRWRGTGRHVEPCVLCPCIYLKYIFGFFFSMVVKHDHSLKRPPTRPKTKTDVGQVVVYFYLSEVKLKIFRAGSVSSTVKRWVSVLLIHRAQGCSFRLSLLFCSCYWLNLGFLFFFFFEVEISWNKGLIFRRKENAETPTSI